MPEKREKEEKKADGRSGVQDDNVEAFLG